MDSALSSYLKDMDSFFYGGNGWQAGLYQLVSDLNFRQAEWKPYEERNSIWKIVKHTIFWKHSILSYKDGKPLSAKERQEGDWKDIPQNTSEELWRQEIKLLEETHLKMKEMIGKTGSELFNPENDDSNYIRENLNHDAYHAGQIGLLRILQGIKPIQY